MKIIHTGDLHLDSAMTTHLSAFKAKERKKELLYSFERMVNFAANNDVKVIIISGDMFDKKRVATAVKRRVFEIISENSNIDFLYISGNHDDIDLTNEILPNNLKTFSSKWNKYSYENIDIYGINFNKNTNMYLYDTLLTNPNNVNIVAIHGQVNSDEISISALKEKNIDYLALGHVHKYQLEKLDDRGVYCYCGCLEGRGFDEIGEKGFVLLQINNNKVSSQFIKNSSRELHLINVDISNVTNWIELKTLVNDYLINIPSKDMVKVVLKGEYELDQIKYNEQLLEYLSNKFYFSTIDDESKLKINIENYENDISLKGEFVRKVKNSNLDEKIKDDIILCGIKVLTGEDI